MSIKTCKQCQKVKNRNSSYGKLPPKIIAALKPWNYVHIDLIGTYYNSIRQHQTGSSIIQKDVRLTCMKIIDTVTVRLNCFEIPFFNLNEAARRNIEYIHKSYARVIHVFNQTWLCRYPHPWEVMFDNCSKFK